MPLDIGDVIGADGELKIPAELLTPAGERGWRRRRFVPQMNLAPSRQIMFAALILAAWVFIGIAQVSQDTAEALEIARYTATPSITPTITFTPSPTPVLRVIVTLPAQDDREALPATWTPAPIPSPEVVTRVARAGLANVEGLIDWNGEPQANITVRLHQGACGFGSAGQTQTDENGRYRFEQIPVGEYSLSVNQANGLAVNRRYASFCDETTFRVDDETESTQQDRHLPRADLTLTSPTGDTIERQQPPIEWETYPDAASYEVALQQMTLDIPPVIDHIITADTEIVLRESLAIGRRYEGSITAYNADDVVIAVGEIGPFEVAPTTLILGGLYHPRLWQWEDPLLAHGLEGLPAEVPVMLLDENYNGDIYQYTVLSIPGDRLFTVRERDLSPVPEGFRLPRPDYTTWTPGRTYLWTNAQVGEIRPYSRVRLLRISRADTENPIFHVMFGSGTQARATLRQLWEIEASDN